jgi:tetratricopeptide (TPR) repeat protein
MIRIDLMLEEAHQLFLEKRYDEAIFLYSQIVSLDPTNVEYQLYPIFCDVASEDDERGQALFEYFTIQKELDLQAAIAYVKDTIEAFDGDNELMMKILHDLSVQTIESLDAIEYTDFLNLVANRGSFREAYEDIMFSTKVAIKSKEDLVDFINQLIDNNFNTTAYNYLDGFQKVFSYDEDINGLYEKLESKNLEDSKK